jgi:V/A-type H+-transporting ATPase subunit F
MYKMAVLGDYDSIYGFAALGLDTFPVGDTTEAAEQLKHLYKGNYAVIYITEAMYNALGEILEQFEEVALPAIIPIPGIYGNTGVGIANVKAFVEKAVGSDIIFNSEN